MALSFLSQLGWDEIFSHNQRLARFGAERISAALGTPMFPGPFCVCHPIAIPASLVPDIAAVYKLRRYIAEELRTELSVCAPVVPGGHASIIVSAFVYNDESEYEAFARDVAGLLTAVR